MKPTYQTVITHGSTLFRDGLQSILSGTPFKTVYSGPEFGLDTLERVAAAPTAIWIIGVDAFDVDIEEQWQRAKRRAAGLRAVLLVRQPSVDQLVRALRIEINGYLDQDIDRERLVRALEVVALGDTVLQGQLQRGMSLYDAGRTSATDQERGKGGDNPARAAAVRQGATAGSPLTLGPKLCRTLLATAEPLARGAAPPGAAALPATPHLEDDHDDLEPVNPAHELPESATLKCLSKREKAILRLLTEGLSNKVIAHRLVITEATVKVHLKGCLRKLRLHNRTQAAMWATKYLVDEGRMAQTGAAGATAPSSAPAPAFNLE